MMQQYHPIEPENFVMISPGMPAINPASVLKQTNIAQRKKKVFPGDQFDEAAIEKYAETQLLAGNFSSYLAYIDSLTTETLHQKPLLLVYKATAMFLSEYPLREILQVLSDAENLDQNRQLTGEIGIIRAICQVYSVDPEKGIALSQKALSKIDPAHIFFRNLVERNLGVTFTIKGDLKSANIWFEKLLMSSYQLADWSGVLAAYNYLTYIRKVQGQLRNAGVIYKKALAFVQKNHLEHLPHGIKIIAGYGHLLLIWNRIEEAKAYLNQAIHLASQSDILYAHTAYNNLSELRIRQNDILGALATIQELRHQVYGREDLYEHIHNQHLQAVEARIHLAAGNLELASLWLQSSGITGSSIRDLQNRYGFELGYLLPIAGRILIGCNKVEEAIRLLSDGVPNFMHQGANSHLIGTLGALAIAYERQGNHEKARHTLDKALQYAAPENNFGDLIFLGRDLLFILDGKNSSGTFHSFEESLKSTLVALKPYPQYNFFQEDDDLLSAREMDVLELIAQGMTNKEIAKSLYLSANTIKSHSINIYRKLEVNNRNQAVKKARSLGLLPPIIASKNTLTYTFQG